MPKTFKLFESAEALNRVIPKGAKKMVRIGEKRVCIFHLADGFKVFDNLCPHNGHSLLDGDVNYLEEIVCPLHGYRYSLNDGRECQSRTNDLQLHELQISDEGVFLRLIT